MKKLFTIIAAFMLSLGAFAQTAKVEGGAEAIKESLTQSYVEFVLPEKTSTDEVDRSAQYYTDYFTVDYDEATKKAKINLIDSNDEITRKVITRFLLSVKVRDINVGDKNYTIMEFYGEHLR